MENHGFAQALTVTMFCMGMMELVTGFIHLDDCPFEPRIPAWLIISGFAVLLRVPLLIISFWNITVREAHVIAVAVIIFVLGAFDLGWMLHGTQMLLQKTVDQTSKHSTFYCDSNLAMISYSALLMNGLLQPILNSYAAINLYIDRTYENL